MSEITCPKCLIIVKSKDFFGKNWCYKCIYKQKIECIKTPNIPKKCLICGVELPSKRWKFCSSKCSDINDEKTERYHWYLHINAPKVKWT